MKANRKTRPDAKLQQLPEVARQQLIEFMRGNSYAKTVEFCREKLAISTSTGALCGFWNWWHCEHKIEEAGAFASRFVEALRKTPELDIDDDKLARIGQSVFEMRAIEQEDAKTFIGLRKVRLREKNLAFEVDRYRDSVQTDIDRALEAFKNELQANAAALAAFEEFRAKVKAALEKKAA